MANGWLSQRSARAGAHGWPGRADRRRRPRRGPPQPAVMARRSRLPGPGDRALLSGPWGVAGTGLWGLRRLSRRERVPVGCPRGQLHDDAGVWGGTSSRQRRELRRTATGEAA